MPRQSRSRASAPRSPPQTRSSHTAAVPAGYAPPHAPAPPSAASRAQAQAQPKQPGMLAQMAATAGSVAVGSTIGHGISNLLFGGRSEPGPAQEAQQPPMQQQQQQQSYYGGSCEFQAKDFTKCLETGDVTSCNWYLEQLKACQAAARPY